MAPGLYTSVYLNATSQAILNGQTKEVYFLGEQADDPGDHGTGGKTVLTSSEFTGAGKVVFSAPTPAGLRAQMVRQQNNTTVGTEWMTDIPAGIQHFAFPVAGTIPTGYDLILEVVNNSGATVTLTEAWMRLFSQAL